jgi:septal ring factor EnvC (AmiA/AmiB activator)
VNARAARAALLVWVAAQAAAAAAATVPSAPSAQDQFEALVREIGDLRSDLEKLDRKERTVLNEMDRLQVETALRARELARLVALKERTTGELESTRRMLEASRAEVAREEAGLARHLRTAYEMGRSRELGLVLSLAEPVDVMRAIAYIDVMAQRQTGVVDAVRRARSQVEALERSLGAQTGSLDALASQQRARAAELEEARRRSAALLAATRQDADAHRSAIAELARAASDLESAIVSNTTPADRPAPPPAIQVEQLRGALEWPVPGEIEVPFGDIRNPRFGTVTPHPGVDIRTEARSPIRAILPGRVVFARRFSGYGNTVLLDHGGHYLTVYARAAAMSVVEGQTVTPGQVIALSADQAFDDGPPTVYFELRKDGKAIDPSSWLKRRAATRREEDK